MDSKTNPKADIERGLALIKGRMPSTYAAIQARAQAQGAVTFAHVRRGLGGQANNFWACEGGYVVGTPFANQAIERDTAWSMVAFGVDSLVIFAQGASNAN